MHYDWKNNVYYLKNDIPSPLYVTINRKIESISYLLLSTPRTQVGVIVSPNHFNKVVRLDYSQWIKSYKIYLLLCLLPSNDILKGYNAFW